MNGRERIALGVTLILSYLLALTTPLHAAEPVLVSSFEAPRDPIAQELAARLPLLLADELARAPEFLIVPLSAAPMMGQWSADIYMQSCPPGQSSGCSVVVAQAAGAHYAITGQVSSAKRRVYLPPVDPESPNGVPTHTVQNGDNLTGIAKSYHVRLEDIFRWNNLTMASAIKVGQKIDLSGPPAPFDPSAPPPALPPLIGEINVALLDATAERTDLDFIVPYDSENEAAFAQAVVFTLQGMAKGEVGQIVDIRTQVPKEEPGLDLEAAAQDLQELNSEMGEVEVNEDDEDKGPMHEARPRKSLAQVEAMADKPWQPMGLSAETYTSWWNSGWDIESWKFFKRGRQNQVLLRPHLGVGRNPTWGAYVGRASVEPLRLEVMETYAWQSVANGTGFNAGFNAGFGILSTLEIEAGIGFGTGGYQVIVDQEIQQGDTLRRTFEETGNLVMQADAGARYVPFPASNLRPTAGLGVCVWRGTRVTAHAELPSDLDMPVFTAPTLLGIYAKPGVEYRISRLLDFFAEAPLSVILAGGKGSTYSDLDEGVKVPYLADKSDPPQAQPFGVQFNLGVQLHVGGQSGSITMNRGHYDDLDEEEPIE